MTLSDSSATIQHLPELVGYYIVGATTLLDRQLRRVFGPAVDLGDVMPHIH